MSYFMKIEAVHKKYIGITNFIWLYMCHFMVEFGIIRWLWMKSRFVHDSRSKKTKCFFPFEIFQPMSLRWIWELKINLNFTEIRPKILSSSVRYVEILLLGHVVDVRRPLLIQKWHQEYKHSLLGDILSLGFKKAGRFEKLLGFARSQSIVARGSVSLSFATTQHLSCFSKS